MKFLAFFILVILVLTKNGLADWDGRVESGLRTFPFGGSVSGVLGWNQKIWQSERPENPFLYGYMRPNIKLESSVFAHRISPELEIAPISFWRLSAGYLSDWRSTRIGGKYNCNQYECHGTLNQTFIKTSLILGVEDVFFGSNFGITWFKATHKSSLPFMDEVSNLTGAQGGDLLSSNAFFGGYNWTHDWSAGVFYVYQSMNRTGDQSKNISVFARHLIGNWKTNFGFGLYTDTQNPHWGISFFGALEWTIKKGLEL